MTDSKNLIIVAAGAFGREVLWVAREARDTWNILGFLDDAQERQGEEICGIPVLGRIDDWTRFPDAHFVIAVGPPRIKKAIYDRMLAQGTPRFATLIHKSAQMSEYVEIGEGSIICAGCVLTTQIEIRRHVVVNLSCTCGHDTVMEDFVTLAPMIAASSRVTLEEGVEIGMFTTLLPGLRLGVGSMVGMGSVVVKDIPSNELWLGSPAQRRREIEPFPAKARK